MVGREPEKIAFKEFIDSPKSEFVVVYGRRRVGKTYLIRQYFNNQFTIYSTGLENAALPVQLATFNAQLRKSKGYHFTIKDATTWLEAFSNLIQVLEADTSPVKVIFFDELPWMDTKKSGFITALEFFWNSWASARNDIKLIVCGSSASWMLQHLINNKKGLHNRVTKRIKLKPFTLKETKEYFTEKGGNYDNYQLLQFYMAIGGIPFYLEQVNIALSAAQNIDALFFGSDAKLKDEYQQLFASLFKNFNRHGAIVDALATKKRGLFKSELIQLTKLADGGTLTNTLTELEASDFIHKYHLPGRQKRDVVYQLTDNFTLFYHNFLNTNTRENSGHWLKILNTPQYNSWAGNAFELLCQQHIIQIKQALGISGIVTQVYAWANKSAQVDVIIDRADNVINLLEIKFATAEYTLTPDYALKLANKAEELRTSIKTKKAIWLTLLTTYGLKTNTNAGNVQSQLNMEIFF